MKKTVLKLKEELHMTLGADALYSDTLHRINNYSFAMESEEHLLNRSRELKLRACNGESMDKLLPEAFAVVSEAAVRALGLKPHDTQLLAGIALHEGQITQMQTGEGKTLAAVLPAYLNALTNQGVHVLTFNDYLAKRDCYWMDPIYRLLGLSSSFIVEGMNTGERKAAYASDITYASAKEAGFDYLRDFLCLKKEKLVHRPLNFAIVDEADSLMIDEARIPLVISGRFTENSHCAQAADRVIRLLKPGLHFESDQYNHNLYFTDEGLNRIEELLHLDNIFESENIPYLVALHGSLHAYGLLRKNRDYIVRQGKIEMIDPFTGRVALNRLYPDNIQTAVEVKEGQSANSRGRMMGKLAIQHFLSLYHKLSGMTGTAKSAGYEFMNLYKKQVIVVPPHRPCQRIDHPDRIFTTRAKKEQAIVDEILRLYQKGQPVLIGTGSIEESERLYEKLKERSISCSVLNARNDEAEAGIISEAGKPFSVTVSTNMAGRGVDIRLGGSSETERDRVLASGGLYILGTQRHESVRIDDQLRGRAGRQGEPGESRFFLSLEDEIIQKYSQGSLTERFSAYNLSGEIMNPKLNKEIVSLQRLVEGYHSDCRYQLLRFSAIVEQQRRILQGKRQELLMGIGDIPEGVEDPAFLRTMKLTAMNRLWMDYLEELEGLREGIHMVALGNKNPQDEFNRAAIEAFHKMEEAIEQESMADYRELFEKRHEIKNLEYFGPTSTFTYLLEEDISGMGQLAQMIKAVSRMVTKPLFTLKSLFSKKINR